MAKKRKIKEITEYRCKHCKHSYDWQNKAWDGQLILCRCPHHKNGAFCKFLDDNQCPKFESRNS